MISRPSMVAESGNLKNADEMPLVREIPVFDPGTIHVTAPKSTFSAFLGRQFGKNPMAERIRRQLGESFEPALARYIRILKEWTRQVTSQMCRKFETYAERYRAEAEQSPHGQNLTMDEVHSIEEDLKNLKCSGL